MSNRLRRRLIRRHAEPNVRALRLLRMHTRQKRRRRPRMIPRTIP